ncbi:MAG: carboxypeptidase regulatory-like domain-containing protein [Myxococcales bacterium]
MRATRIAVVASAVGVLALVGPSLRGFAKKPVGGSVDGDVSATPSKFKAGVVLHLEGMKGTFAPPSAPVDIDQRQLRFVPRVVAIQRGTTVRFVNDDSVNHNVFSPEGDPFDLGAFGKGKSATHVFSKTGAFVQLCRLHPEMEAYVVVVDSPFFAVTDAAGHFHMDGVPPGHYTVRAWSERLPEASQEVTVAAGEDAHVNFELKR